MKRHIAFGLLFLLILVIFTYPLVFNLTTYIPGFFSTDEPFAQLWEGWRARYAFTHHLKLGFTDMIAFPSGLELFGSGFSSFLYLGLLYSLNLLTASNILSYNIEIILNFFLSFLFVYLLALRLTGNAKGAFISGITFAFCPFRSVRNWQHLSVTFTEWIPLVLLTAIMFRDRPTRKYRALLFLSILLLISFDFSIMYIGIVSLGAFVIYSFFLPSPLRQQARYGFRGRYRYAIEVFLITCAAFLVTLPQFMPILRNIFRPSASAVVSAHNFYHRPFEDLFAQSARPLSYFLPPAFHPVLGKFTAYFIGSPLYGMSFTEHTLYLGWTPLILALVALRRWQGRRPLKPGDPAKTESYIGLFIFIALVAWIFSQPPWWKIGPLKIYMPSFFIYKISPMYRAYCRFGILVMLAVAVLAGYAARFVMERFKTEKARVAVTSLLTLMILFEFWNYPPFKVIDASRVPQVYYWLKGQPGEAAVAEYPLDADSPNERYKFYQTIHERKMINGAPPYTGANNILKTITKLSEANTAGVLRRLGVKYVLVHRNGYLRTELVDEIEELARIPRNKGLRLIRSFPFQQCPSKEIICIQESGAVDIYEVIAEPREPLNNN